MEADSLLLSLFMYLCGGRKEGGKYKYELQEII
jgi:hypothetical protein